MTTSQNGWPVDTTGAHQDRGPIHGTVPAPNGVRAGDVAIVLRWVAARYHATVEPLIGGTCWGWYVKHIEGSNTISNHASGTAVDFNADRHPMGKPASANFTPGQIAACHAIVKAAGGVVRWGGDYTGRPDPMHWEIVGDAKAVAALAHQITEEENDMPLSDADIDKIAARVWAYQFTRPDGPDAHGNTKTSAGAYQCYSDVMSRKAAEDAADRIIAELKP